MQKSSTDLAGLSTGERELLDRLMAEERAAVTASDVMDLRGVTRPAANRILSRLEAKGWLQRIKRGLYAPIPLGAASRKPAVEDAWTLAMRLFSPCHISGWSAAEHWDLTEQIFNAVAIVTSAPQRRGEQTYGGVRFRVRTLHPDKLFGSRKHWVGSHAVMIADPSRMLIDILDAPEIGGGGRHAVDVVRNYWRSDHADADTLLQYAIRYDRGAVFKRIGYLAELCGVARNDWLARCRQHITKGVSKLDPAGPDRGPIVSRWNLRVNIPVDEARS
ncbi:MAG: type IV toxin-antitoxin system AbiEi family antitoxin domain-containing protein [Proteobacteria bacterium]|nr:type IV toxin-antitoxin system AbiEi family antitoxin domain-containing protein [Pseudomonadota bacterium]